MLKASPRLISKEGSLSLERLQILKLAEWSRYLIGAGAAQSFVAFAFADAVSLAKALAADCNFGH